MNPMTDKEMQRLNSARNLFSVALERYKGERERGEHALTDQQIVYRALQTLVANGYKPQEIQKGLF